MHMSDWSWTKLTLCIQLQMCPAGRCHNGSIRQPHHCFRHIATCQIQQTEFWIKLESTWTWRRIYATRPVTAIDTIRRDMKHYMIQANTSHGNPNGESTSTHTLLSCEYSFGCVVSAGVKVHHVPNRDLFTMDGVQHCCPWVRFIIMDVRINICSNTTHEHNSCCMDYQSIHGEASRELSMFKHDGDDSKMSVFWRLIVVDKHQTSMFEHQAINHFARFFQTCSQKAYTICWWRVWRKRVLNYAVFINGVLLIRVRLGAVQMPAWTDQCSIDSKFKHKTNGSFPTLYTMHWTLDKFDVK